MRLAERNVHFFAVLNKNKWRWQIILAGAVLLVRLVFILKTIHIGGIESMDGRLYHSIALNLMEGRGYSDDGINPTVFAAPLYSFIILLVYKIVGPYPLAIEFLQAILGVGSAFILFQIGEKYFSRAVGWLSFTLMLIFPDLIVINTFLYTESVFIFFFILMLWSVLRMIDQPKMINIIFAGIIAGLTTLVRGITLFFPILIFIILLINKTELFRSLRITFIFCLCFILPLLPWMYRNYRTFHAVIPVAVGTGDVLWTGNYLPFDGKFNYEKTRTLMDSMTLGMNQIEREQKLVAEAKKNMRAAPEATAWLMIRKYVRFWFWVYEAVPMGQKRQTDGWVQTILMFSYYPVLVFFLIGIYFSGKSWHNYVIFYLIILYYSMMHAIMLVTPRYRIPILPIMFLFATFAFVSLINQSQKMVRSRQ